MRAENLLCITELTADGGLWTSLPFQFNLCDSFLATGKRSMGCQSFGYRFLIGQIDQKKNPGHTKKLK
jgi:hypothetical protein